MKHVLTAVLIGLAAVSAAAQRKTKVETGQTLGRTATASNCAQLVPGKVQSMPAPRYPEEARSAKIGGPVEVTVKVDETGRVTEIVKIDGPRALHGSAGDAALKSRFAPTLCDNRPVAVNGTLTYNFIPYAPYEKYYIPDSVDGFRDISRDSPYFEAILDLTDNYRIAFGYGDRSFYPDFPMPKGDLAYQLQLTLDFLKRLADDAKVNPGNAYRDWNPRRLSVDDRIEFGDANAPYANALVILLKNYNISLFNERNEFDDREPVRSGELIALWKGVFGDEAVPVNFDASVQPDRVMTRGEFALFLHESMRVLTYKLLPVN